MWHLQGRAHIHNHIIFNSTSIDGTQKFRDFKRSGLALQKVSDMVCLENGLSVIEPKPKSERVRRTDYPKRNSFRNAIREDIRNCIKRRPKDFEEFLRLMAELGYEVKQGKNISFKGKGQERFIRMRSLGENLSEEAVTEIISGKRDLGTETGQMPKTQTFNLLIDIQARMADKRSPAYRRWATVYNLKQMSGTFMFLRENHIERFEDLDKRTEDAVKKFNELNEAIKASEKRLAEILALKKHILNYRKTKDVYVAYRKAGYSQKFFEEYREEITLHKAAKEAFEQLGVEKLPTIRLLNEEYDAVLRGKKAAYAEYRTAKKEMQEYLKARKNVSIFYRDYNEKDNREPAL